MAESEGADKPARSFDHWKWLQVLVIPITTLIIGQYASNWQEREGARRTYADMIARREAAESALRKDMFQTTVQPFLDRKEDNVDAAVLRLELLASNFHDSLDLSPLFKDVYRTLKTRSAVDSKDLLKRLTSAAQQVIRREIEAIREAGTVRNSTVDVAELEKGNVELFADEVLSLPGDSSTARVFRVQVVQFNEARNEFSVRLTVSKPGNPPTEELKTDTFHVGLFDFPLIDNTRLAGGPRVALALDNVVDGLAHIKLIYFPGSRASLKDKQYYEDIAAELLRIEQRSKDNKRN